MNDDLRVFYGWVRRSREILFGYCTSLPPEIYTQERPDFAFGSMRNLHAHVADCYLWWVGTVGLGKPQAPIQGSEVPDVAAMRKVFAQADAVVEEALQTFNQLDQIYEWTHPRKGWKAKVSQRWLLLHPITHEFHHKGQITALGRVLGHPAVLSPGMDTDLVNPEF
ncbi:DinB family protein [Meiothermus hypogaeus]|uniref:DNA damage-inducible protein DinB n=2 Tax=Meiothermus hypogaeus TaxID=884155 RepID=A0A511R0M3_9DEIN|nr:DinB family protein [Meiothermus hypogaeus]RIH76847.1 DinB family protein [Meiothermus hypogaeus]GEM83173.1 DNA damage-inducible protein DinB [Meiothermus hypogaeus NBRC 106114]